MGLSHSWDFGTCFCRVCGLSFEKFYCRPEKCPGPPEIVEITPATVDPAVRFGNSLHEQDRILRRIL